jgi:tRNA(Ile2) C34 agmatinyltransferase TiaS
MTDISQVPICEKCGSEMEFRREGSSQGLFCTNCDWSVVTTYIPEILLDETLYEVIITDGNPQNKKHISTVSHAGNINFLSARKSLREGSFVVFKGIATEVVEIRKTLDSAGLSYKIAPEFPW